MPVSIVGSDGPVGCLIATGRFGRRYHAEWAEEAWAFQAGRVPARSWWATRSSAPDVRILEANRSGFRRRRIQLMSGIVLDWRQRGWSGSRYELSGPRARLLLSARNLGDTLRWRGRVVLHEIPPDLGEAMPLLVLFSVFLIFNSSELIFA